MAKVYTIANKKGGCAKTTTAGALSSGLARYGYKVLAIDCDPQGNLTNWNRVYNTDGIATTYDVIISKCDAEDAIIEGEYYDLIPSDEMLANAESALTNKPGAISTLGKRIESVKDDYDFIILDTPPNPGFLTLNAYCASDGVIVTSDASAFATQGMGSMVDTLNEVKEFFNPDVRFVGVLLCRVNMRTLVYKTMNKLTDDFAKIVGASIYDTKIRQSVVIMDCQMRGVDIFDERRRNPVAEDYQGFAAEFLEKEGYPKPDKDSFKTNFGRVGE